MFFSMLFLSYKETLSNEWTYTMSYYILNLGFVFMI